MSTFTLSNFKGWLFLLGIISLPLYSYGQCTELFISEYVEGSGSEKYIEIYNPTSSAVDLADYELRLYSNGNSTPNSVSSLVDGGILAPGGVMVLKNGNANLFPGGIVISAVNHNGDDAYDLYNTVTGMVVDIFGEIGVDPGSSWLDIVIRVFMFESAWK